MRILGAILTSSLAVTESILLLEGRWQEAIPLHLCSLSALAAVLYTLCSEQWALDFLWYLGMPGACLALMFPAPAVSEHQALMDISYVVTHGLILVIPTCALASGQRIRRGRAKNMLLALHGLASLAYMVNCSLGTDYMFLMAPPYGTPLCTVYRWGYGWYILVLEALISSILVVMGVLFPKALPILFGEVNV